MFSKEEALEKFLKIYINNYNFDVLSKELYIFGPRKRMSNLQ